MILTFILGIILGITVGSFIPISVGFFIALIFVTLITFVYKFFVSNENRITLSFIAILLFGILIGVGRIYLSNLYSESNLSEFVGQKIVVEGIIVDEPDARENNTKLTVRVDKVLESKSSVNVDYHPTEIRSGFMEKILVTVPTYPNFEYGDMVRMKVTLVLPTEIETDGRVFDYNGYLRVRGIWYTSRFTTIELISSGHGSVIKTLLFKTKNAFTESINNVLPQPESSLLGGLLLGSKQSLGKEKLLEFQKTGVSHIVVLSGYNIAIVANSIIAFLKFLPKNFSFGFGAMGIVLFAVLSGGGASVWRAAIMVLVALFAKQTNRDYKVSKIFAFTIVLMLTPNPLLLAFDPSFQLSVLATSGLIFVSPLISQYFLWVTEKFGLREIVAGTIATQVTVLPYLIYNMGILSLVSLPVNILILGTIPITMFFGFVTGIVGLFSFYLSFLPAFFTYILLWYQLKIVHLGSIVPFGAINLPAFSPVILIFIYLAIFAGFIFLKKRNSFKGF